MLSLIRAPRGSIRVAAASLLALAGSALAAPPAVLDRVPADAPLVFVARDLNGVTGMAGQAVATARQAGDVPGMDLYRYVERLAKAPGVDLNGSVAVVMLEAPDVNDPGLAPDTVMIVPVTDYAALVGHFGGDASSPVATMTMSRREMFARKIDDRTALLGNTREAVETFKVGEGAAAGHLARMGAQGRRVADTADALIVFDAAAFREQLQQAGAGGGGGPGGIGDTLAGITGGIGRLMEAMARDGRTGVFGLSNSDAGMAVDLVAQFSPGSDTAKTFESGGNASALLSRLPNQRFYAAMAADFRNPGMRAILAGMGEGAGTGGSSPFDALGAALSKATGMAMVVGTNPNGPLAGVLVNTSAFIETPDGAGALGAIRTMGEGAKDRTIDKATIRTDYKREVATINGAKVDSWSTQVTLPRDDPNAFMAGMMMQTLFGQSRGFSQMAAAVDTGLVMTMSQNTPLVTSAIDAATKGGGLGTQALFAEIREHLPTDRVFEVYLGTPAILEFVQQTIEEMLGEQVAMPKDAPLVGLAGSAGTGAMHMRLFIPAKTMAAVGEAMRMWQGADDDFEPMDAPMGN